MGWVTLDDGQHVFIGAGGKVLATRGKISSAGGAKERGKALAARSKAAIAKARQWHGRMSLKEQAERADIRRYGHPAGWNKPSLREQAAAHRASKGSREERLFAIAGKSNAAAMKLGGEITKNRPRPGYKASENKRLAKVQEPLKARKAIVSDRHGKIVQAQMAANDATTRAIEHAKAAGPTLREQAEKARAAKGTTEERTRGALAKARSVEDKRTKEVNRLGAIQSKGRDWKATKKAKKEAVKITSAFDRAAIRRDVQTTRTDRLKTKLGLRFA